MFHENWIMADEIGYTPLTTFWDDFFIAEHFGEKAIRDTYNRAFKEWKGSYKYLTELVMVLNHKIWRYYGKNDSYAHLYNDLWEKTDAYAHSHLKGDELRYFYRVTD